MASIVSAGTTSATALNMSADTSGVLQLASNNGTVAVTVTTGQIVLMGTTDITNTSRLKLTSTPTANRAVSAQLTVERTNAATQYEGVCFNAGSARAAYILRIPGSDDLTFGFDAGSITAEAMRLTTAGSLGVGTTNPSARLNVYASGATFPLIRAQSDSPTGSGVYGQFNAKYGGTDRDWFFGQASDSSFGIWDFTPGVTNRLSITTGGFVGINVPSPTFRLQVNDFINCAALNIGQTATGSGYADGSALYLGSDFQNPNSITATNANFRFCTSRTGAVVASNPGSYIYEGFTSATGSRSFAVLSNGNVQNSNNSYGSLSDASLKQDVVDATSQWNDIKALKVRKYRLIAEVENDSNAKYQIGLVAQEAAQISAGLIEDHKRYEQKKDENGELILDSYGIAEMVEIEPLKAVKYSVLYMKAIKALQEAMERIEALEAKAGA